MFDERPFHFPVADRFASLVEVQQAVQPDRYARENPVAQPQLGPDRAAGPQPDQREPGFLLFFRAGPQVDVHERVELVDDDVNVVGSDACRQHGHALARIISGGGHEFAVRCPVLDSVEPGGDLLDPSGVSDQYDGPSQLLGAQVQMKDRTVGVDDQFGRGYRSCHVFYGVSDRFRIVPAGRLSLFSRSAVSMRVRTTDRLRRCGSACGVVSFFGSVSRARASERPLCACGFPPPWPAVAFVRPGFPKRIKDKLRTGNKQGTGREIVSRIRTGGPQEKPGRHPACRA